MKIVYDTPKKEFEPFSICIETEDEAKIITALLVETSTYLLSKIVGKQPEDMRAVDASIFDMFNALSTQGYSSSCDLSIKYE